MEICRSIAPSQYTISWYRPLVLLRSVHLQRFCTGQPKAAYRPLRREIRRLVNSMKEFGGARRNRTADMGFADPCLTTWRPRPIATELLQVARTALTTTLATLHASATLQQALWHAPRSHSPDCDTVDVTCFDPKNQKPIHQSFWRWVRICEMAKLCSLAV